MPQRLSSAEVEEDLLDGHALGVESFAILTLDRLEKTNRRDELAGLLLAPASGAR
jgi:hypothetical protein